MAAEPLFPLEAFYAQPGITHVCAAGESLPLLANNEAFLRYMGHKSAGTKGREDQANEIDEVRGLVAKSWGAQQAEIGFASSVAEGVSMVLESLNWRDGDNVLFDPKEFPSVVASFALAAQRRRQQSAAPAPDIRYAGAAAIENTVDSNTRLIAISYVSYLDGTRVDLAHYRRVADAVGAILLVDFTQAAGYTPIEASIADFAFSACYKFLLGTTGAAIAYWNKTRQPNWRPATAGWHSLAGRHSRPNWTGDPVTIRNDALSFARGNPSHPSIYILGGTLKFLLQWDVREIESHVHSLTTELIQRLEQEGIPTSTPKHKDAHGANVAIDSRGASEIVDGLKEAGVWAWNGYGRVRFSFHGYNCVTDVDRIMAVLPSLYRKFDSQIEISKL